MLNCFTSNEVKKKTGTTYLFLTLKRDISASFKDMIIIFFPVKAEISDFTILGLSYIYITILGNIWDFEGMSTDLRPAIFSHMAPDGSEEGVAILGELGGTRALVLVFIWI